MTTQEQTITTCDTLLRGELSAIETYSHAIHKFPGLASTRALEGIRKDHLSSAAKLRKMVSDTGESPSTSSGLWGDFAKAMEAGAAILGEASALAMLKQGEKHGVNEYEAAIAEPDFSERAKAIIRSELLPPLHAHVLELERIH